MIINGKNRLAGVLLVSLLGTLYGRFFIGPFAERYGFSSGYELPQPKFVPMYVLLTTPIYLAYIVYLCASFEKIKSFRWLVYPVMVFGCYCGLFTCLLAMGGPIMWFAVFTFPVFIIIIMASITAGIVFDFLPSKKPSMTKPPELP